MNKKLPIGKSPIQCYPDYGTFFGIVDAYTKNYLDWIYNYFIQLVVTENNYFRVDFCPPRILKAIPWLDVEKIDRQFVVDTWNSYENFVIESINHGKYIYALMDTAYTYGKNGRHFLHEHLIYGYDDMKYEFYFYDNYANGKYKSGIISFDDLERANKSLNSNNLTDWYNGIMMLSYINLYDYGNYVFSNDHKHIFNKEFALELMADYLYERCTEDRWIPPTVLSSQENKLMQKKCWGIGVYRYAKDYLKYVDDSTKELEIRGFYAMHEHKKIIKDLIINHFANSGLIIEKCDQNIKISENIVLLCLKYNLTNKQNLVGQIRNKLECLQDNDIYIFSHVLNTCE